MVDECQVAIVPASNRGEVIEFVALEQARVLLDLVGGTLARDIAGALMVVLDDDPWPFWPYLRPEGASRGG
jgi:hypothetical protein